MPAWRFSLLEWSRGRFSLRGGVAPSRLRCRALGAAWSPDNCRATEGAIALSIYNELLLHLYCQVLNFLFQPVV